MNPNPQLIKRLRSPERRLEQLLDSLSDNSLQGIPEQVLHLFALWCAEQALSLIDEPDPRSVGAIWVKWLWLVDRATEQELEEARDAAWASWEAARDADWASQEAQAASQSASWIAARATRAADWAARDEQARYLAWLLEQYQICGERLPSLLHDCQWQQYQEDA